MILFTRTLFARALPVITSRSAARTVVALGLATLLAACGTNPVTGKRELQFISTTQEIAMGAQAYFPTRQAQGGDYIVHEGVTRYVQRVNNREATASDRDLPYEIVVLNSSVPNAWAMPGGKMAINRGLLTALGSEAELAAVLGHEIVHAAARHSAKGQERGLLLQTGLLATQIAVAGEAYGGLAATGAMLGATLINTRYGREAELESDLYGMEYMHRAGYNPAAAIDLQQTFVKLSEGRQSGWLEGLFASHPPSQERVERNRETAARLGGADLEYGRERYKAAIAPLVKDQAAYEAHDNALKAARADDFATAGREIDKAIRLQPREAKFHGLKGDMALHKKQYQAANRHYDKAIGLYPDYFAFHLQKGVALQELGNDKAARAAFEKSNALLPTPNAQKALGDLALAGGDRALAIEYFSAAAAANSAIGQEAALSMATLELEERPGKYLKTRLARDQAGQIVVGVSNQSPVPVTRVEVSVAYFDQYGRQVSEVQRYPLRGSLPPGEQGVITTRLTDGSGLRAAVSSARIAKQR
ncbi:MAG: M48 family metalloprotease [Halioglobus sp.]|nr:M48 family metalloprotease [Halioglobus sp.]